MERSMVRLVIEVIELATMSAADRRANASSPAARMINLIFAVGLVMFVAFAIVRWNLLPILLQPFPALGVPVIVPVIGFAALFIVPIALAGAFSPVGATDRSAGAYLLTSGTPGRILFLIGIPVATMIGCVWWLGST